MPELPEVESARRLVEAHAVGKTITEVYALEQGGGPRHGLFDDIVFANSPNAETASRALVGLTIDRAHRRGKQMWWEVSGDKSVLSLLCHFGMTGSISVKPPRSEAIAAKYKSTKVDSSQWPPRFTKLEIVVSDGTRLAFSDPRRLGRVYLVPGDPLTQLPLSALGPDAFTDLPPHAAFSRSLRDKSVAIKVLLLDQSFVAGIGNYIADEVLYKARIHPDSPCNALDDSAVRALHDAIAYVIGLACSVEADYERFPPDWLFHRRWEKGRSRPKTHDGLAIEFLTVGGRTSAVVPALQKRVTSGARAKEVLGAAIDGDAAVGRPLKLGPKGRASGSRSKQRAAGVLEDAAASPAIPAPSSRVSPGPPAASRVSAGRDAADSAGRARTRSSSAFASSMAAASSELGKRRR